MLAPKSFRLYRADAQLTKDELEEKYSTITSLHRLVLIRGVSMRPNGATRSGRSIELKG